MEQENKNLIKNVSDLIEKVDSMKKQDKMDLSSDQDLSIAIMNLVSIEEHFFFTGAKLGKPEYYDLLQEVRKMRGDLLRLIVKDPEGEQWCISKHLLAASMRVMEVATKQQGMGRKEEAKNLFQKAYDIYSLFWAVNMKIIKTDDIKKIDDDAINVHDKKTEVPRDEPVEKNNISLDKNIQSAGFMGKMRELVKKAIDCCIE